MTVGTLLAMSAVAIGFLLFGAAFYGFMQKWSSKTIWLLCIGAFVFATVIPVVIALGHAI